VGDKARSVDIEPLSTPGQHGDVREERGKRGQAAEG
jgi:hypothetical protein